MCTHYLCFEQKSEKYPNFSSESYLSRKITVYYIGVLLGCMLGKSLQLSLRIIIPVRDGQSLPISN